MVDELEAGDEADEATGGDAGGEDDL